MVGDIATPENRGRMMSSYQGFFLIGVGLGPAPGGLLADHFGLRAPFLAYAAFSAVACVLSLVLISETRPHDDVVVATDSSKVEPEPPGESMREIVLGRPFLLIGAISFVAFFARTGALFTVVPLLGKERIGLTASDIGLALTLVNALNIATLYPSGIFADRFGRKRVIVPATLVSGVSLAMFALSHSFGAFLLSAAVWGVGSGVSGPAPAAYVADIAGAGSRGRVFGLYRSVADLGYIAGPLLLGWLTDVAGYSAPLMITAALFLLSGVLFALFAPELHARTRADEPLVIA
jgi:MFS family permease